MEDIVTEAEIQELLEYLKLVNLHTKRRTVEKMYSMIHKLSNQVIKLESEKQNEQRPNNKTK